MPSFKDQGMRFFEVIAIFMAGVLGGTIVALVEAGNWIPFPGSLFALSIELLPHFAAGFTVVAVLGATTAILIKKFWVSRKNS
jgi:hypothetical protein